MEYYQGRTQLLFSFRSLLFAKFMVNRISTSTQRNSHFDVAPPEKKSPWLFLFNINICLLLLLLSLLLVLYYSASIRVSGPLVSKIEAQSHEAPEEAEVQRLVYSTQKEKYDGLKEELEEVKAMLPEKTQRAVDLASEKGASNWHTVISLKDMDFDLNKQEFRDALRL